jgi:L-arabinokinase
MYDDHKPACGSFRWDQACVVSRAPGRMDVMGGIADYSGALVLQMPISEACHVALQRQQRNGPPSVRVVSFHGDSERPSRSFEAPLAALFPAGGQPIEYEAARAYFTVS